MHLASKSAYAAFALILFLHQNAIPATSTKQEVIDFIQASTQGKSEKVAALLDQGVDVNVRHQLTGWTALMAASLYGRVETVEILLRAGASVDLIDNNRSTALMKAVQMIPEKDESALLQRKSKIISLLLNAGADPYLQDKFGSTPWQVALERKETVLVEAFEADRVSGVKETRLMLAIAGNDIKKASQLIHEGASVNYRDASGANSLSEAILSGNVEILKIVIDAKADLDARFDKEWTALMLAAQRNQPEMVRILLESGANSTLKNEAGLTALQIAEITGNTSTAEILRSFSKH